jgi:hypothetical protein
MRFVHVSALVDGTDGDDAFHEFVFVELFALTFAFNVHCLNVFAGGITRGADFDFGDDFFVDVVFETFFGGEFAEGFVGFPCVPYVGTFLPFYLQRQRV